MHGSEYDQIVIGENEVDAATESDQILSGEDEADAVTALTMIP